MKKRLVGLDILRIIAVYGIMLAHINSNYPILSRFGFGPIGVSFAFIISGFLVGYRHANRYPTWSFSDSLAFWKVRLRRFYPIHLFTMVIAMFLQIRLYFLHGFYPKEIIKDIITLGFHTLLLHSFVPIERVFFGLNGASWFLSTLMPLYFLTPWLLNRFSKRTAVRKIQAMMLLFLGSVLTSALAKLIFKETVFVWYRNISPFIRFFDFSIALLLGMLCAEGRSMQEYWSKELNWQFLVMAVITLAVFLWDQDMVFYFRFVFLYTLFLVLFFALADGIMFPKLESSRWIGWLSGISFEVYLLHSQIIGVVAIYFQPKAVSPYLPALLSLVLSVAGANLLHRANVDLQKRLPSDEAIRAFLLRSVTLFTSFPDAVNNGFQRCLSAAVNKYRQLRTPKTTPPDPDTAPSSPDTPESKEEAAPSEPPETQTAEASE